MLKFRWILLLIICLEFCFPQIVIANQDKLSSERLAQWNLHYASYLIDIGKYLEALDAYNTAYEVTSYRKTKLKALLYKANLLATFLDAEHDALKVYNRIIKEYPEGKQIALYRKGLLLFDMRKWHDAIKVLSLYLKEYPKGDFRFQAEVLLEKAKKAIPPPPPPPAKKPKTPKIRVLLYRKVKKITIKAKRIVINKHVISNNYISCFYNNGLYCTDVPNAISYKITAQSPIEVSANGVRKKVRGDIILLPKTGHIMVINVLDIEKYLWAVVPSESYPSWPLETLKAQAVASRTYAFYQILHRKNWEYDVVDNEGDQAYKGITRERSKTTKAVQQTVGLILVEKNRPILAMYTANSGGYTADASYIFNLYKAYLVAHPDPLSLKGKMAYWRKRFSIRQVERLLNRIGLDVQGLENIVPVEKGPSNRIIKVKIIAHQGSNIYRTSTILKRALRLPDILFSIKKVNGNFIFEGRGWGHGVGYSQWGAAELGRKGYTFQQILKFYYPHTKLKKVW